LTNLIAFRVRFNEIFRFYLKKINSSISLQSTNGAKKEQYSIDYQQLIGISF